MNEERFGGLRLEKLHGTEEQILREALPFIRVAYEKAKGMIAKYAIQMESFVPPYDREVVKEHEEWVQKKMKNF